MNDIAALIAGYLATRRSESVQKGLEVVENAPIEVAKCLPIMKAWTDGGMTYIEGWISTDASDLERDEVPPEAFKGSLDGYFMLGAPVTSDHQMKPDPEHGVYIRYPVGHMQSAALVRDGHIFQKAYHPSDPAEFQHFPGQGTGWYGRTALTDDLAASQVTKGNVRGFSWVGLVTAYTRLPNGGRRFETVSPLRESTLAAFPINTTARVIAAQ